MYKQDILKGIDQIMDDTDRRPRRGKLGNDHSGSLSRFEKYNQQQRELQRFMRVGMAILYCAFVIW